MHARRKCKVISCQIRALCDAITMSQRVLIKPFLIRNACIVGQFKSMSPSSSHRHVLADSILCAQNKHTINVCKLAISSPTNLSAISLSCHNVTTLIWPCWLLYRNISLLTTRMNSHLRSIRRLSSLLISLLSASWMSPIMGGSG